MVMGPPREVNASGAAFLWSNMPDDLPVLTHTTTVLYKSRSGELKELQVVQPLDPHQKKLEFRDLQILAAEIGKVLREDAA